MKNAYSIVGSLETEKNLSNELELIAISELVVGSYLIMFENNENQFTSQLIILR